MLMGSKNEPSHCVLPLGGLMEWDFMGIDHDISKKTLEIMGQKTHLQMVVRCGSIFFEIWITTTHKSIEIGG